MRALLRLLTLTGLALASCDNRAAPVDASPDRSGLDLPGAGDKLPWPEAGRSDGPRKIDQRGPGGDGLLGFCSGPAKAIVDGKALTVTSVKTGIDLVGNCCPPGESIRLEGTEGGQPFELNFQMTRFPNTPPATHLDLGKLPGGWVVSIRCEPSSVCGQLPYLRPDNSSFSGTVDLTPSSTVPLLEETVRLCVSATPLAPSTQKPVQLWVDSTLVHLVCVPGMDQTCNNVLGMSSLHGKCNEDSTCTCYSGQPLPSTGKCP